jgi:hypothetical protein
MFVSTDVHSPLEVSTSIPIAFEVEVETAQGCEGFNHVFGDRPLLRLNYSGVGCFFEKGGGVRANAYSLSGSLASELILNLWPDFECDGDGVNPQIHCAANLDGFDRRRDAV